MVSRVMGTLALVAVLASPATAQNAVVDQAEVGTGEPLQAWQLALIYADKSWLWERGAAYFAADPREFKAVVKGEAEDVTARGRWLVNDRGLMCMDAVWSNASEAGPIRSCFGHKRLGRVIYQRREPDGEWYVFEGRPHAETDEANRLTPGEGAFLEAEQGTNG